MFNDKFNALSKNKQIILRICLIGIFSALSFIGTTIKVPIPAPLGDTIVHLGNLVVVIASLLFGGITGGLSGSIGMGLYDIYHGYDIWSITRTLILKLVMGLIVGILYQLMMKKKMKKPLILLYVLGTIFFIVGLYFMIVAINNDGIFQIGSAKETGISPLLYIFSIIIGLFLLFVGFFSKKFPEKLQIASIATSFAMIVNIIGEFIYKVLKQMTLYGSPFIHSIYVGIASIPATIITATLTLVIIIFIFLPIEEAVNKNIEK